jgi:oligopeptide transport system substrate-binding protein
MQNRAKHGLFRWVVALALILLLSLSLSGCGNNPYPPGQTSSSVIFATIPVEPKDLDPTKSNFVVDAELIYNIYGTYYKYDYLKHDPYVLDLALGASPAVRTPGLVTDTVNGKPVVKKGEIWTFRIRPGLHFQDDPCFPGGKGREILASDFIYSFRRMADPALASPGLGFIQDKIAGYNDYANYCNDRGTKKLPMDYTYPVPGLQLDAKDPYTFHILTNQPFPQLRYLMAMVFTSPLPHEAIEKYGDLETHPVGCGQYIFKEIKPRERWIFAVNPNRPAEYYPTSGMPGDDQAGLLRDAGKRLPLNSGIRFDLIPETVTSWNLFQQGYTDLNAVTPINFNQVVTPHGSITPEMARRHITLFTSPEPTTWYLVFNMKDPVVGGYTPAKRALRQAISCAIDSQNFIDLFNNGNGIVSDFTIPPGLFGYDPNYVNPYDYNLDKARQLLAKAGYPGGVDPRTGERLTLYYESIAGDSLARQQDEWTQKQFATIGINLVVHSVRDVEMMMDQQSGRFQIYTGGWSADYPDPEDFVMLLYSKNPWSVNGSGYANSAYDRLYEQMRGMDDSPERLAIIKQMRAIAVEDCPEVYMWNEVDLSTVQGWLHNVHSNPMSYDGLEYQWADGRMRAQQQEAWNRPVYWPLAAFALFLVLVTLPAINLANNRRTRHVRRGAGETR